MATTRGRDAYRAVYLASPLKFCTTLHAFTQTVPRHFINPWQKDAHAAARHKWRTNQLHKKGPWGHLKGPLVPLAAEGFPDLSLVGARALPEVALRAVTENLQAPEFWHQLAERTRSVRDLLTVGDIADILDALVTADYRHTDLMTVLVRELVDDVDKLSIMEVAAVAYAYSHFNCFSELLFNSLSQQTVLLLSRTTERGEGLADMDVRSLAVLLKAFKQLGFRHAGLMQAVSPSLAIISDSTEFPAMADIMVAFAALAQPSEIEAIPDSFWKLAATKVPGSRMASQCPALASLVRLKVSSAELRQALTQGIVDGLQAEIAQMPPLGNPPGSLLLSRSSAVAQRLLPFAPAPIPKQLFRPTPSAPRDIGEGREENPSDAQEAIGAGEALLEEWDERKLTPQNSQFNDLEEMEDDDEQDQETTLQRSSKRRWYNPIARGAFGAASGKGFAPFDASKTFGRNRRGALVAEALHGLSGLWLQDLEWHARHSPHALQHDVPVVLPFLAAEALEISPIEQDLCDTAGPLLGSALQGVPAAHLASCAEVYALLFVKRGAPTDAEMIARIVREAIRKLANFDAPELRRLYDAATAAGARDAYLERARRRRFPKTLRNMLRDESPRAHPPVSPPPQSENLSDARMPEEIGKVA